MHHFQTDYTYVPLFTFFGVILFWSSKTYFIHHIW